MGCQSSKSIAAASPDQPPFRKSLLPSTGTTLLQCSTQSQTLLQCSTRLPTVDVQVIKQENARREVMAAAEEDRPPQSTYQTTLTGRGVLELLQEDDEPAQSTAPTALTGRGVLEQLAAGADERGPSQVPSANTASITEEAVQLDMSEKQLLEYETSGTGGTKKHAAVLFSSPAASGPIQPLQPVRRRQKVLGCDCCECEDSNGGSPAFPGKGKRSKGSEPGRTLENLIEELFRAHDLNGDGMLDEMELIKLNEAVAEVHDAADVEEVHMKYSTFFREKLDPDGKPVPYSTFRKYIIEMLDEIDQHEVAQEMIVEQFLAEARLARTVVTGDPLLVDKRQPGAFYDACFRFCPKSEAGNEVHA